MEILIKGSPEVLNDLAGSLRSSKLINDILEIETITKVDVEYDKDVIIINLD